MNLLSAFRLSTYLTLILACVSLGYAQLGLLPEIPLLTAFSVVLLVIAFALEGHWSLTLSSANVVGGFLAAVLGVWIAYQFVRPSVGLAEQLPFPTRLLPYLGPVLMILIPAKLLRPKLNADYWAMHGLGILAMALGCAMAHDRLFDVLLIIYLFLFVWSITLFYLGRTAGIIETEGENRPLSDRGSGSRWLLSWITARWSIVVVVVCLPLYWMTPTMSGDRWEFPLTARGKIETGLPTGDVDLNNTGKLATNEEVAFEVTVEDREGRPKVDLDPNQRWRSEARPHYEKGTWPRERTSGLDLLQRVDPSGNGTLRGSKNSLSIRAKFAQLPDYGPNQYYLSFDLHRNTGSPSILADPVYWKPGQPPPVIVANGTSSMPVVQMNDGSFRWQIPLKVQVQDASHIQTTIPMSDPSYGPPMRFANNGFVDQLIRVPDPTRLTKFTSDLLDRLVQQGKLSRSTRTELDTITRKPLAKHHAAIAKALEEYLASGMDFRYSLEQRRVDKTIDPIEDFLFNVKKGHCQRYATALALMLRTQGIPTQFVLGFKGFEQRTNGRYVVRQSLAHAWVEALIPVETAPKTGPRRPELEGSVYRWLTLDPTPSVDAVAETDESLTSWVENGFDKASKWVRNLAPSIAVSAHDYWVAFTQGEIRWPWGLLAIPAAGLIAFASWRLRRKRRAIVRKATMTVPFQRRLLEILRRHQWVPQVGQTPLEFAESVQTQLAQQPETEAVANIPVIVSQAYYRVGFGGEPCSDVETAALEEQLNRLQATLKGTIRSSS